MVTSAPPLVFEHLAKSFGSVRAVDDLTFTVRPGAVTGFLGPNGAGKTTTLRVLLGLAAASKGRALVGDRPYEAYDRPGTVVGAALETSGLHPGRTGLGHLEVYAPQVGASRARCREVLEEVELGFAARRRAGTYSLGMRQRLALATALLADPPVLVLDEPTNGLDPEGIVWLRGLLRRFADEGRTVLVSSHLLAEVQASVDDVVVIAQGRLRHASSLDALRELAVPAAYVETPMTTQLTALAAGEGWQLSPHERGFLVTGAQAAQVGRAAHVAGLELHQLVSHGGNLEEAFFALTRPEPAPSAPPPTDTRPGGRSRPMTAALVAEFRKVLSTRLWWLLLLVMAAYLAFVAAVLAFGFTVDGSPNQLPPAAAAKSTYSVINGAGYVFPLVIGTLAITTEYRHRTITTSMLLEPRRTVFLVAKLLAVVPVGLLAGVVGTAATVAGGAPVLAWQGGGPQLGNGDVLTGLWLGVVVTAIWAAVGVALGSVLSNQVAAIVVVLAFTQFVEPVARLALAQFDAVAGIAAYLPGAAADALIGASFFGNTVAPDLLPRWGGALVLVGYVAALAAVGRLTTLRRDVA